MQIQRLYMTSAFAMTLLLQSFTLPALSADSTSAPSTPATASTPAASAPATAPASTPSATTSATTSATPADGSAAPLQAGVQHIELNMNTLRDVGIDIKNLLKTSGSLYDEVNIRPVTIITEPEVIGYGTVINVPIGTQPAGPPAPPRKARLDMAMNHLRPLVQTLKQDVDDFETGHKRLDITDDTRADLRPLFEDWIKLINDINGQLTTLNTLTQGPTYDNSAISQASTQIHTDSGQLEEVRRRIYKYLQKEGKQKAKKDKKKNA